ncbi:MAG: outer membrane lipoprotein chaperone LolA, partial [Acidobacteria bacterium]|nr:outer membrane lipoprotein chaperone LolA [Acidobacteriota bacterium]
GSLVQEAARPSPAELAKNIQGHYSRIQDFSADFLHTYEGGVLRRKAQERGTVLIKKPGKMRWSYREPERKLFVSDGQTIYAYIPTDRQVIVSKLPSGNDASTPALFLTGAGDLLRDFVVSDPHEAPGLRDSYTLQLVPRSHEPEYEVLLLTVDRKTLGLRGLVAHDHQGGRSSFVFTNLKENIRISDKEFVFQMPKGVEIVGDAR